MYAIKGVGYLAAKSIIRSRNLFGNFFDISDFIEKINLRIVNKKVIDSLVMSGAFDSFEDYSRKEYLFSEKSEKNLIENFIIYGAKIQKEKLSNQQSLFLSNINYYKKPIIPHYISYSVLEKLILERDLIGFYISDHPLNQFKIEIDHFCNCNTINFLNFKNQNVYFPCIVSNYFISVILFHLVVSNIVCHV